MDRRAKFALAFLLVAFFVGAVAPWSVAQVARFSEKSELNTAGKYGPDLGIGDTAGERRPNARPSESDGPGVAAPAIIDVVYFNDTDTPSESVIWVVFDKPITPGNFVDNDFLFSLACQDTAFTSGLSFAYHEANSDGVTETDGEYTNVLEISGFAGMLPCAIAPGAELSLRSPERLGWHDATPHAIKINTVAITKVEVIGWEVEPLQLQAGGVFTNRDTVRVYLTHEVTGGVADGGNARAEFDAPELGTSGPNPEIINFSTNDRWLDVGFTDNFSQGKVREGVTQFRFDAAANITGRRASTNALPTGNSDNADANWVVSENEGPRVLHATDNPVDQVVTVVFSDDIDPNLSNISLSTFAFNAFRTVNGVASQSDGDNVIEVEYIYILAPDERGPDAAPAISDDEIIIDMSDIYDHQGNVGIDQVHTDPVDGGLNVYELQEHPDIVQAFLLDDGISEFINVVFNTDFVTAPDDSVFAFRGLDPTGLQANIQAPGRVIQIRDYTGTWEQGDRIYLTGSYESDQGVWDPFVEQGLFGGAASNDTCMVMIFDRVEPITVDFDNAFVGQIDADTTFIGFDEIGTDDSAYYLLFARRNTPITPTWAESNVNGARVVTDPNPGYSLGGVNNLNDRITATYVIDVGSMDTEGIGLEQGDDVFFAFTPVDLEGNWDSARLFGIGSAVAGPLTCPRDTTASDDNLIVVYGTHPSSGGPYFDHVHYICGEPTSAPTDADSVYVFADEFETDPANALGRGVANPDGSWGPIELDSPAETLPVLWVRSGEITGVSSVNVSFDACPILNDVEFPEVHAAYDPTNEERCYSPGDTLRLIVDVWDNIDDGDALSDSTLNPLLCVWVDLSGLVTTAGSDSVALISLGANQRDDDNDWNDTAYDGIASPFHNNGSFDPPEPYIDENGDGVYTPGEPFIDLDLSADYNDNQYDAGDLGIDVNDPDENGRYYLNGYYLDPNDIVADPNGVQNFAVLEDVNIPIHIEDNAVLSDMEDVLNIGGDFDEMYEKVSDNAEDEVNPLTECPAWSYEHHVVNDTMFVVTEDSQAPTVSEISFLEYQVGPFTGSGWPGQNLISPGDRCYTLPSGEATPWFNLADSTLSDDDVTMVALQINAGGGWGYLSFDRPGDPQGDGMPGIPDYDDDGDGAMDLEDTQVANASEEDAAADASGNNDGIHRQNDNIDNDNDAFFRYNPIYGGYVWFNIDETDDNNIDDDGDGNVDNETETYNAANDDDEDGIEDGSAVGIAYGIGQRINDIGGSGTIYVAGFKDPAQVAFYDESPTGGQEPVYDDTAGTLSYPNDLVGPVVLNSSEEYPNKYVRWSQINLGADNLGDDEFALGAPNIIHAAGTDGSGPGSVPWPYVDNHSTDFGFDYRAKNGKNLNARVIQYLYSIPDGVEFEMRAVAFDACYQGRPDWAVPICLAFDSTAPTADIPDDLYDVECDVTDSDVDPEDGIPDGTIFTITAPVADEEIDDVDYVEFQLWDPNTEMWVTENTDMSPPFQFNYQYPGPVGNNPPDLADTLYWRAIAWDEFGNAEDDLNCGGYMGADSLYNFDDGEACFELMFIIEDCTAPTACICQVGYDYDLSDGAFVPSESAVDVSAWFTDGDGDSTTNDVVRILFEYRPVGTQDWLPLESLTGVDDNPDSLVDVTGIHHPVVYTGPDTLKATVTWDTRDLPTGSYELRAVAFDIEGNPRDGIYPANQNCIFSVTVDDIGLRAYIQPCVMTEGFIDSLFANVYIHDVAVDQVEFQYYEDTDQDGIDNDGNQWHTISVHPGVEENRGDVILRAGFTPYYEMKDAVEVEWTTDEYKFYDVDGDGYNPVDPIVLEGGGTLNEFDGSDTIIIDTNYDLQAGDELTAFDPDEYFADTNGNSEFDEYDWVMLHNPIEGDNDSADFWCTAWDVSGFDPECYMVRAVATDALGNVDDDDDDDGTPDSSPTEIWTETCCVDTDVPLYCITHYLDAEGDSVGIEGWPNCDYVAPQECFTLVAEIVGEGDPSEVDSVVFEWSDDQGFTWNHMYTDEFGPDFTAKYYYADSTITVDRDFNFRARAYKNGQTDLDPNQCKICLTLGENQGPETDIVLLTTAEGDTLITNTVLRGNLDPFCIDPTVLYMHVTAEDNANIDSVWVMVKKVAGVDAADTTDWMKAVTDPTADDDYPYEFNWDITGFEEGLYAFFPRGIDQNGNVTPIFGNPFYFSLSDVSASVVSVEKNGQSVDSVTPGEELVIKGELDDNPSDNLYVYVHFYYQDRIEGELQDPSPVGPNWLLETMFTIYGDEGVGTSGGTKVYNDGLELTEGVDWEITASDEITMYVAPGDSVTVDYNITDCKEIESGDYDSPYSVAWDADGGSLAPFPINDYVTHFSFSATAIRDFPTEGDFMEWECEENCDFEDFVLPVNDTEAPEFTVYGFCYDPNDEVLPPFLASCCNGADMKGGPQLTQFPEWPPQTWLQFMTNWPGNAVCATCGGSDINEIVGDCKCKFSGIENQFWVVADEDVASVEMSIGGNAPVSFTKYEAHPDSSITIPITFYLKDMHQILSLYGAELNDIRQAVNPDSVENVRIYAIFEDGETWEAAPYYEEMTHLGNGIYQYDATFPTGGGVYGYAFAVDYVGDLQIDTLFDPKNLPLPMVIIPEGDFWCYSQETDPEGFFGGVNQLEQVTFEVTDEEGNVSTHLTSGGPQGPLGQTWVTYDRTPPVVDEIWLSESVVSCDEENIQINVAINDLVPATADVIELHRIVVQVSMDDNYNRWRNIFYDFDSGETDFLTYVEDGGWGGEFDLPEWMNPYEDGIDNDLDGLTDEEDEKIYTYRVRAVAWDDCWNAGYSCGEYSDEFDWVQENQVCAEITVDCDPPQACLTTPEDGSIVEMGSVIDLVATSADTDIEEVTFQYWLNPQDGWQDIDCTPLNDDDEEVEGNGPTWECSWDTSFLASYLATDFYVRLRVIPEDMAGNEGNEEDCDINIVINDVTGPVAAIMGIENECDEGPRLISDPYLVAGEEFWVSGTAVGWNAFDVATVTLQWAQNQGGPWTTIGVANEFDAQPNGLSMWEINYEIPDNWPEGIVYLRAYATDNDGNVQNDEDQDGESDSLPVVSLMIDLTAPTADLMRFGAEGDPLRPENNGLEESDLIIGDYLPDVAELCDDFGPVTVWAQGEDNDGDAEVKTMELQILDDVHYPENPRWFTIGYFEYRDAPGDGVTPDGTWVLVYDDLEDLADEVYSEIGPYPSKEYRFRAYTCDYACNVNEDEEGMWLFLDAWTPTFPDAFAGGKSFEGGETPVLVAGGDTVPLAFVVDDITWDSYEDGNPWGYQSIQHETSGIWGATVSYRPADEEEDWRVIGSPEYDDNGTPDFYKDDVWRIDWETPMNMPSATDTCYSIRIDVRDNAGWCGYQYWNGMVCAQDVTPPEDTKLIAVLGEDCGPSGGGTTYPYTPLHEDLPWPSAWGIDETALAEDVSGEDVLGVVSKEVTLMAMTPAGDASMYTGGLAGATVYFEGRVVGDSKGNLAIDDWYLIGTGECTWNCVEPELRDVQGITNMAHFDGPIWTTSWNTLAQHADGTYIWFDPNEDGTQVQIRAWAEDAWGNVETIMDDTIYRLVVDNVAPSIDITLTNPDPDAAEPTVGDAITAERNSSFGVAVEANTPDDGVMGGDYFWNQDVAVTFYYKLGTDLDEVGSWHSFEKIDGFETANDNPDITRPYVFHWNTNGFRDDDGDPLVPNEDYHLGASVTDLVCNTTDVVGATKRDEHGTLTFIDTIAPQATIVCVVPDYPWYCETLPEEIWNAENVRINGFTKLYARILDGSLDTEKVEFYYREQGTNEWILADADITVKDLDGIQTWELTNWASAPLSEGTWEFAAVAEDDAGNVDDAPPVMTFIIDRSGPVFAAVEPTSDSILIPENHEIFEPFADPFVECNPDERLLDLIATTDALDVAYKDSWDNCVHFEWKFSKDEDVEENWNRVENMTLYDGFTGRYSSVTDMYDWEFDAALVDWRVVATDWAGNCSWSNIATQTIWDNVPPTGEITYVSNDGAEDTTLYPISDGQVTDVSHGDQVTLYATVTDDEVNLPESHETQVSEVQFFVKHIHDDSWSLLGTAGVEEGFDDVLNLWHVTWNTSGLTSTGNDTDIYRIRIYAVDEAGNCGPGHEDILVYVTNKSVPLAQVSAFNPDLLGAVSKSTNEHVYGLTFGEKEAEQVFFQYMVTDYPDGSPADAEWTTLGIGTYTGESLYNRQASLIDQDLWRAGVRTSNWPQGALVDLRAVGADQLGGGLQESSSAGDPLSQAGRGTPGQGGISLAASDEDDDDDKIFGDLYDLPNTPVLQVRVDEHENGATILTPSEDLGYFADNGIYWIGNNNVNDSDCYFVGRFEVETADPDLIPFVVVVGEDGEGDFDEFVPELDPRADYRNIFVSKDEDEEQFYDLDIDPTEGAVVTAYASVHVKRDSEEDAPGPRTEMVKTTLVFHEVNVNRGSNGVVGIYGEGRLAEDGYPTDVAAAQIPAGAVDEQLGLAIMKTDRANIHPRQVGDVEIVGNTYRFALVEDSFYMYNDVCFEEGREMRVWVRYDEADLVRADGTVIDESRLTLRNNDDSQFTLEDMINVQVDTVANVITAELTCINSNCEPTNLVVVAADDPSTITAHPYWNGYTDMDPILRGTVEAFGVAEFWSDEDDFDLRIDGELVFASNNSENSSDWWYKYPGSEFTIEIDTDNERVFWEYRHSCNWPDALTAGEHYAEFSIEWDLEDGNSEQDDHGFYQSKPFYFSVDREAPTVDFRGGFIGHPIPDFADGYTDLTTDNITVNMWDYEAGVLLRPARVWDDVANKCPRTGFYSCSELYDFWYDWFYYYDYDYLWGSFEEVFYCEEGIADDIGFKVDVWVVDPQGGFDDDQQDDIDEFQERTLLTTITADAVAAYTDPPLAQYTPGDTLSIPLNLILGDTDRIQDGSILELVIYSDRVRLVGEWWDPSDVDDLDIEVLLDAAGLDFYLDTEKDEYYAYTAGIYDCVLNVGNYIEQRFIVDISSPEVIPTSDGLVCGNETPSESISQRDSYTYSAEFSDGAGVDPASVEVSIEGPSATLTDVTVTEQGLSAKVVNSTEGEGLEYGVYAITVTGTDWLGNEFSNTCRFRIGGTKVGVTAAQVVPNPFQPDVRNAEIRFDLPADAHVTITAYDWAGDQVGAIFSGQLNAGPQAIAWGGNKADGSALANGVYLLRIVADDGSRKERDVVKVAIWNER